MGKILIIDDEPVILNYVSALIETLGHSVLKATTGADGCRLAAESSPDMIISDLYLSGEPNGIPLIKKLRESAPSTPIVVITGHPSQDVIDKCNALGISDFLTKPFELPFIKSLLNNKLAEKTTPER